MTNSPIQPPTTSHPPSIEVSNLSYSHPTSPPTPALININLSLPPSSRTLLIGANGAGKTTLLRLLSGKKLAPQGHIHVSGVDPFRFHNPQVTYLGLEWILNPIVRHDIPVHQLLDSVGGLAYPERREELVRILDVDEDWKMHIVSDGERRRVQLCMGLIKPWEVLLLDEVTVDLDVLARGRFLGWLKNETERRGCTIVYATHVMDGLGGWPTHLVRMTLGEVRLFGRVEVVMKDVLEKRKRELDEEERKEGRERRREEWMFRNSELLELVMGWLEEDFRERGPRKPRRVGI